MGKEAEEQYKERVKRIDDATRLKVPDRIPFFPMTHFFAANYAKIPSKEAFYNIDSWFAANRKMITEIEPDLYFPPSIALYPGRSLDFLECKQIKWPGHGVPSNSTYQFVEGEYMKEDEYDAFLEDPSDYLIRVYLPRIFGSLEPLQNLPPILALFVQGYKGSVTSAVFANSKISQAFESLYKAAVESMKYLTAAAEFDNEMKNRGFPMACGPSIYAPYDYVCDMLRGMHGTMLDMYRQPDKLLQLMDRIFPILLRTGIASAKKSGNPRVFIPLHRGSDGFMSLKQYETFYWPGFKRLIDALINENLTPCPFFEGDYTTRLEYLKELPKTKIIGFFDTTDIFKAKEVLGDTMCIAGNMPLSLLKTGTADQVRKYAKKLIDIVGEGGGFIMSAQTVIDDASPELVKIWGDYTKEYGVY